MSGLAGINHLGQIVLDADIGDGLQLRFKPIGMGLLIACHLIEDRSRRMIAKIAALLCRVIELRHDHDLRRQAEIKDLKG